MATCDPSTLLLQGKDFQGLEEHNLYLACAELCREWAASSDSPSSLLNQGAAFQGCDDQMLKICIAQLLCNINGDVP
jgi:hypothetical protein